MKTKRKPNGFFKKMVKEQWLAYGRQKGYDTFSRTCLFKADSSYYQIGIKKDWIDSLIPCPLAKVRKESGGFFSGITDKELREAIEHKGFYNTAEKLNVTYGSLEYQLKKRRIPATKFGMVKKEMQDKDLEKVLIETKNIRKCAERLNVSLSFLRIEIKKRKINYHELIGGHALIENIKSYIEYCITCLDNNKKYNNLRSYFKDKEYVSRYHSRWYQKKVNRGKFPTFEKYILNELKEKACPEIFNQINNSLNRVKTYNPLEQQLRIYAGF